MIHLFPTQITKYISLVIDKQALGALDPITWTFFTIILISGCNTAQIEAVTVTSSPVEISTKELPLNQPIEIKEDLYLKQIRDGVFVVTHEFPWPANSLIVQMDNGDLVLVDTPYTPDATKDLLNWIETELGARDLIAINSGFHVDNLGGNNYLIEQGIPVYGSELTVELIKTRGEKTRQVTLNWLKEPNNQLYYEAHQQLPYVAPNHLFKLTENPELKIGDETIQIYYPGAGHKPDNIVVHFPNKKVLFGGCMILAGDAVGNTSDADLAEWPNSVKALSQFDFDLLIPGHGDRFDKALLEHTNKLLSVSP